MDQILNQISVYFTGGALGGLSNALIIWIFGMMNIPKAAGVALKPAFSPAYLYPKLVWGAIWGLAFLMPNLPSNFYLAAFLVSLGPTLIQSFVIFPYQAKKGMLGLQLGTLTPVFVVLYNYVWALTALCFIDRANIL
ncbi:MAG: hypothetical protein E2O68_06955 [Deltaproteobacteria bacterium]|nr:MAG: hypothetical protein E2O68_06955 [Deltaproteobacteria bacterium]